MGNHCRASYVLALALVAFLGVACGQAPTLASAAAAPQLAPPTPDPALAATVASKAKVPVWHPAPPGPGERVYESFGVRTSPAPPGIVTAVSAADVLTVPDVVNVSAEKLATGTPDIELRLVTTGDFPPGSETVNNPLKDQPGWVLTFQSSTPAAGGSGVPGQPGVDVEHTVCTFTIIIDATSAADIANFQECHGFGRSPSLRR
ncbi:hypothetical protein [Pseudonocardia sp.]|jgi:hypothetical protein|uniref:hypothetical protein n=1 Tax=Pseudonocardia sp. TaxID=60912 RepID=UPI002608CC72|nr:hypothetical protein [Pseudonocardia sp.]MCW2718468.1 hypothetical protein [Pseudonocardia sp.]